MLELSFIVPIYNAGEFLEGCLSSLFRQNLDESIFEVICVNDGSTDNSREVLQKFERSHKNIRVINQQNAGVSSARNAGIDVAQGKYVRFVDSDDYIADSVVENSLNLALENDLDLLYTSTKLTAREDLFASISDNDNENLQLQIMTGKELFVRNNIPNGVWEFFIKKEFITRNRLRFVSGRLCEDGIFTLTCLCKAERAAKCRTDFYRYVNRMGSITNNSSVIHQRKMIDDFAYAILFINSLIFDNLDNEDFSRRLIQRRDAYCFFMQIRMVRSSAEYSYLFHLMERLREKKCYPNNGLTNDYGRKMVFVSRLFQKRLLFDILLRCTRNPTIHKALESIIATGKS